MSLLVTIVLLLGNAFFVGAEFALIASRATLIEPLAAESRRARGALAAMRQLPLMIAGAQLGITICSLGLGAIAEPALAHLLEPVFEAAKLPGAMVHPVALIIALAVIVFLHTVLGEMVPKNITLAGPEQAVLWLGPPMLAFCTAFKPLLIALKWAAKQVLRLWRIETTDEVKTIYTAEELAGLVAESRTEGLLDEEEHARITGALALHQRTAADAMRTWSQVVTVRPGITAAELEALATRARRSRFPVVDGGRVLGFVHVKDVLGTSQPPMLRPLPTVPPTRTLADLLLSMRRDHRHIVLVGDAGSPLGIVTLDDVLNAVVGPSMSPA
ncbi:hemolysin family protein [Longispora albida]|uniref:hemolysin family protein n=1 Tax=Longispora albida TaxID=203523 RepID=UPI0003789B68|nr:hemolysin family protein [Longispora albida]